MPPSGRFLLFPGTLHRLPVGNPGSSSEAGAFYGGNRAGKPGAFRRVHPFQQPHDIGSMKNIPGARGIPDRHLEAFRPEKTILRRHPTLPLLPSVTIAVDGPGLQQLPAALLIGQIPEHIPVEKFRGDKNIQTGKQLYNPLLIIVRIHYRYNAVLPGKKSCRRAGGSAVFQMKVFCFAQIFIIDFLRQQFSCGALLAD